MGTLASTLFKGDIVTVIGENNKVMWHKPDWQAFIPLEMPKYYIVYVGNYKLVDFEPTRFVESNFGPVLVNNKNEAGLLFDENQKQWNKIIRGLVRTDDNHIWEWNGEEEFIDISWPEELVTRWEESELGYEEFDGTVRQEILEIAGVTVPVVRWDAGYLVGINTQSYVDSYLYYYSSYLDEYSQKDKGMGIIPTSSFKLANAILGWGPAYIYSDMLDQQQGSDIRIFEPGGRARFLEYIHLNPDTVVEYNYYDYQYQKTISYEIRPAFDRLIVGRDVPYMTYNSQILKSNNGLSPRGWTYWNYAGNLIFREKINSGMVIITRDLPDPGFNGKFCCHVDYEARSIISGMSGIRSVSGFSAWDMTFYQTLGQPEEYTNSIIMADIQP
jgi:hypothetical protein